MPFRHRCRQLLRLSLLCVKQPDWHLIWLNFDLVETAFLVFVLLTEGSRKRHHAAAVDEILRRLSAMVDALVETISRILCRYVQSSADKCFDEEPSQHVRCHFGLCSVYQAGAICTSSFTPHGNEKICVAVGNEFAFNRPDGPTHARPGAGRSMAFC